MGHTGRRARRPKSRLGARVPVARTPSGVSNGKDSQLLCVDQERDAVGEAGDRQLADREAGRHSWNLGAGVWPGHKVLYGPVDCREEGQPQTRPLSLIPERSLLEFG